MDVDFVLETTEGEGKRRVTGCLTGWEAVVFEVEDLPEEPVGEGS